MSFDAVTSIVDFLKVFKRVQLSLYDEARKLEAEFTRIQATRNKREPLSNRGYRIGDIASLRLSTQGQLNVTGTVDIS